MIIKENFGKIEFIPVNNKEIENSLEYFLYKLQNKILKIYLELEYEDNHPYDPLWQNKTIIIPFGLYKINFSIMNSGLTFGYNIDIKSSIFKKLEYIGRSCSKFFYYNKVTRSFELGDEIILTEWV